MEGENIRKCWLAPGWRALQFSLWDAVRKRKRKTHRSIIMYIRCMLYYYIKCCCSSSRWLLSEHSNVMFSRMRVDSCIRWKVISSGAYIFRCFLTICYRMSVYFLHSCSRVEYIVCIVQSAITTRTFLPMFYGTGI